MLYLFIYTCCLSLVLPPFLHHLYLPFFVPFLILSFYRSSLVHSLWWSLICGCFMDLFSSDNLLGAYASNYLIITCCLYRYRLHFFEERFSTLPLLSFLFTLLSSFIHIIFFYLVNKPFSLSWEWVKSDLLFLPCQVAVYAILAFLLPISFVSSIRKHYRLWRRKVNL